MSRRSVCPASMSGIVSQHSSVNNVTVLHISVVGILVGRVSSLYATTGQAGATAFIAAMALTSFWAAELRPTALLANNFAAGYATRQLDRRAAVNTG